MDEADVDPIARQALADEIDRGADDVAALAGRMSHRARADSLPRVVLVGPPNAGKSRLFNALAGAEHAIVSPVAGTTRDFLNARCDCAGLTVELIDTAGADEAHDPISAHAQQHRESQTAIADLLLECIPASNLSGFPPYQGGIEGGSEDAAATPQTPSHSPLARGRAGTSGPPCVRVATMCDLAPAPSGLLATSAVTALGIDPLRQAIAAALRARAQDGDAVAATGARCRDSLRHAEASLRDAADTLRRGGGEELVAIDLRQALDDLGRVVGAVFTDDLLDRIFSRFCIGK